ncbi:hypothetical protein KIN20_019869 [Parelaphostrongylus tenuis]|uniref:Uncharacterized protein n=1 Tax=Parelaphostrongylus tenuis TaxID=148309 RepID=A0AAD5N3J0_PARTN|nr:hypothetical protein KIN20_019869 [Parelaphostrongylus tenuis]
MHLRHIKVGVPLYKSGGPCGDCGGRRDRRCRPLGTLCDYTATVDERYASCVVLYAMK